MKKYIILLFVCFFSILTYGQEAIFNTDANGCIIPNIKFIDPIENGDYPDTTPYVLRKTEIMDLDSISYIIKCHKYKGWEYNVGDFNVIDILNSPLKIQHIG